jgi:hypothetical protein
MDKTKTSRKAKDPEREDRLKAALKANMARRKAQSRARATATDRDDEQGKDKD